MSDDARRRARPIARLLDAAGLDLDAATRLLAEPPNVRAASRARCPLAIRTPAPKIADLRAMLTTLVELHQLARTEVLPTG
jgi:hypothetical protein